MLFGDKLKELRLSRNIYQKELANELKISQTLISRYEANIVLPTAKIKNNIILFFGVPDDFFDSETQNGKCTNDECRYEVDSIENLALIVGNNIKNLRKLHKVSQKQLATSTGIYPKSISRYESGKTIPDLKNIMIICKYFNVSLDIIINDTIVDEYDEFYLDLIKLFSERGVEFNKKLVLKLISNYLSIHDEFYPK